MFNTVLQMLVLFYRNLIFHTYGIVYTACFGFTVFNSDYVVVLGNVGKFCLERLCLISFNIILCNHTSTFSFSAYEGISNMVKGSLTEVFKK